ncbi:MAG TPA: hypothetical protein VL099_05720 [Candidatus Binatia bacterium]|nr:hypothetical protein [Candidatus Binatia bacterium]
MSGMMKVRLSLVSFGFGLALALAPAAHAQAESSPDHFTETGVEVGPGGTVSQSASHSVAPKTAQHAKSAAAPVARENSSAAPVHVAVAVADKNRPAPVRAPKR